MKQNLSTFKIAALIIAFLYVAVLAFEQYRIWRNSDWQMAKHFVEHRHKMTQERKEKLWNAIVELDNDLAAKLWIMIETDFRPF